MSMSRLPLILFVVASATVLSGCSVGSLGASGSTRAPSHAASAPASASPSHASSTGGSAGAVDVCAAVPLAAVNAATGRDYTAAESASGDVYGVHATGCQYHDGDIDAGTDQILLDIQVFRGGDPRGIFAYQQSLVDDDELQSISGIGDSAQLGQNELDVAWGGDVVAVIDSLRPGDMSPLTRAAFESLANKVHSAL